MAVNFSDNFKTGSPKPTDDRYYDWTSSLSPWSSTSDVNANIPSNRRFIGLTVNVLGDEYWYATGITNSDLVLKTKAVPDGDDVFYGDVWMSGTTNGITLESFYDNTQSAGRLTGGDVEEGSSGVGYVKVGAGTGLIKDSDSRDGKNRFVSWDEKDDIALSAGYNYIYYNAVQRDILATTDEAAIIRNDNFNIGRVYYDTINNTLLIRECGQNLWNLNRRLHRFGDEVFGTRRASGIITSSSDGDHLQITAGVLWGEMLNRFETPAWDSSSTNPSLEANAFYEWYFDGTDYVSMTGNTLNLDDYNYIDDGAGTGVLTGLTTDYYTVRWIYVAHNGRPHVVIHDEEYSTLDTARSSSQVPGIADVVRGFAVLSARIIIREGEGIVEISSAFDETFTTALPSDHNSLSNIQGGLAGEYYHLTAAETLEVNKIPDIEEVTDRALTGVTNGLQKDGTRIVKLGGTLTESTTISGGYNFNIEDVNQFNLSFTGTSTITDNRSSGNRSGIIYGGDYSDDYTSRSLVDKAYVDAVATGLQPKAAVVAATTSSDGNQDLSSGGVPATIDDITINSGDRVLVKNQTNAAENGIYIADVGAWERADDFDGNPSAEIEQGALIPVLSGLTNQSTSWILVSSDPIDVDVDDLNFSKFSQLILLEEDDGITISTVGQERHISINLDSNSGLSVGVDGLKVDENIAGNGLTWNSGVIDLGGDLSSSTTIDGDNTYSFNLNNLSTLDINVTNNGNFTINGSGAEYTDLGANGGIKYGSDYSINYTARSLVDVDYVTGITSNLEAVTDVALTGATNGLTSNSNVVELGGDLTKNTGINGNGGSHNFSITEMGELVLRVDSSDGFILNSVGTTYVSSGGNGGIKYNSDYSGDFTSRSLVDKEYVDTVQSFALTGATNGLSVDGQDAILGGSFSENINLSGDTNTSFLLSLNGGDFTTDMIGGTAGILGDETTIVISSSIGQYNGSFGFRYPISHSNGGGIEFTTGDPLSGGSGLFYDQDYSVNFIDRSIPDVGYVTGITSQLEQDIEALEQDIEAIDVGLTGSTNGLDDSDGVVELGGTLTKTTTITGNLYDFTIDGVNELTLSASTVNLGETINIVTTPTEITSEAFTVLVRDDASGEVKTVDGSELGEDNNNYFITTANTSTTLTNDMYVVLVDSSSSITLTLPSSPVGGQVYKIKDATGDAITNVITIDGNGRDIDNAGTALINTDYGAIEIGYDSDYDKWFVLSFVN
ncbi:MAG: hypothetical protein ACOCZ5_00310 [bacterium]